MSGSETKKKWIEIGYDLFENEGPEGVQVERMSRILKLNKSGFYHHFGNMELFSAELVTHHQYMIELYLADAAASKNIDPEYLLVMLKHKHTILAHIQLVRNKTNHFYYGAHKEIDEKVGETILTIWSAHVGMTHNPDTAFKYHGIVRDMVLSRLSPENFTYETLRTWADDVKQIVSKATSPK
jgi:AcrR family transcriptional regulator